MVAYWIRSDGKEGVVLKRIDAPFSSGRPNSGGSQLKFKFVETASLVVTGINRARSINLGPYGTGKGTQTLQPAGNPLSPLCYLLNNVLKDTLQKANS